MRWAHGTDGIAKSDRSEHGNQRLDRGVVKESLLLGALILAVGLPVGESRDEEVARLADGRRAVDHNWRIIAAGWHSEIVPAQRAREPDPQRHAMILADTLNRPRNRRSPLGIELTHSRHDRLSQPYINVSAGGARCRTDRAHSPSIRAGSSSR